MGSTTLSADQETNFMPVFLFVCFELYASFLRGIQYFISLIFFLRMTLGLAPVYLPFPEPSVCFVLACPYVDAGALLACSCSRL